MAVNVNGKLPADAMAKDIILAIIAKIGTGGGQGYVIEYRGEAIPQPHHGRAHDRVQHVHRGRCAWCRHDRAGRDHVRVT